MTIQSNSPTIVQESCMAILLRIMQKIKIGNLTLFLPDNRVERFGDHNSPLTAQINVLDYSFLADFILRGVVELGESFMAGSWDTKDIPALFRVFIKNRRVLSDGYPAAAWLLRQKNRLVHFAHKNTLIGSRKNIKYHYDLSNITISQAQYELDLTRIHQEGLEKNIDILLQDYREIKGLYDKIVSVEMLEAVGHRYFGTFFRYRDRLLKPGGLLVIQVITIPHQRYEEYRHEADWIQKHIFPGGLLPSVTVLCEAATKYSSFIMESLEDIGLNYVTTLKDWREKFLQNIESVSAMGFDCSSRRKWEYYLATCEAGFAERVLGDVQVVFRKPEW